MRKGIVATAMMGAAMLSLSLAGCASSPSAPSVKLALTVEDYYTQPNAAAYDKVYQTCATKVGVKVTSSHVAGAGLIAKVLQQSSSKTLPDVLMLDNPDVQQIAATGALSPLSDYDITGKGIAPGVIKAGSYQGKLYGLAPAVNSLALFYNTDLFTAAGLTPPKTWDELKSAAQKLTKGDQYGFAFSGINTYEGSWQFMPWMWTNGGDEKNIDTPQTAQALQFLVDLVNDGSASKSVVSWTQDDVLSQFTAGKAAMMENGPWNFAALQAVKGLHWSSVPIPTRTTSQDPVAPLGGETFTVPRTSDKGKMAAAGKLVACIGETAQQTAIAKATGLLPSNVEAAQTLAASNPLLTSFATTVKTARGRTSELGDKWPAAATKIYTAEQLALTGQLSPSAALAQAQAG